MHFLVRDIFSDIDVKVLSRYMAYLDNNRAALPQELVDIAMSFEYYDRQSENSPLDQELASLDESENSFDVITVGRKEEDRLRFRYLNLAESSMPELRGDRGPLWVIDEFQHLTKNTFRHEIIWYIGEGLYQRWWFVAEGFKLHRIPSILKQLRAEREELVRAGNYVSLEKRKRISVALTIDDAVLSKIDSKSRQYIHLECRGTWDGSKPAWMGYISPMEFLDVSPELPIVEVEGVYIALESSTIPRTPFDTINGGLLTLHWSGISVQFPASNNSAK